MAPRTCTRFSVTAIAFPVPCRQVLKVKVLEYQVGYGTRVKGTIIADYPVIETASTLTVTESLVSSYTMLKLTSC